MNAIRYTGEAAAPIREIEVELIKRDTRAQQRDIFTETWELYTEAMRNGDVFPPVVVFFDGVDFWLADGFHRHWAAFAIQKKTILADVRDGSVRDAILYSVGANSSHGRPRTDADRRKAILRLLEDDEWAKWSDREIARRCKVHHTTVSRVKADVAAFWSGEAKDAGGKYRPGREVVFNSGIVDNITGDVASEERTYTTKHGTVATMDTSAIGKLARQLAEEDALKSEPTIDAPKFGETIGGVSKIKHTPDEDEITEDDLANDPGFQKAVEALANAKALYDEVAAMPSAEPMTPEREANLRRALGAPEDRANFMKIVNAIRLVGALPDPSQMVKAIPPALNHAIDVLAILAAATWLESFARSWESKGAAK